MNRADCRRPRTVSIVQDRLLGDARQLLLSGNFSAALAKYERLARSERATAGVWFEYGTAAAGLRDYALADHAWSKAIQAEPRNSQLLLQVGHHYQHLRMPERACACFTQAAQAAPRAMDPRISLAVIFERQHRLAEARTLVQECLRLDSRDEQARYLSAVLARRENHLDCAEAQLRDLLVSEPRHPYVRYACRYELARLLDRQDQADEAMKLLAEAKRIVRTLADTDALLRTYDACANSASEWVLAQPRDVLSAWAQSFPSSSRRNVPCLAFLGGHPRSGTTLLEQMLDAHPRIAALDESSAFLDILEAGWRGTLSPTPAHLNAWRDRYITALLDELGPEASGDVLVDKNPSLTFRLPLWLRTFPELRVIIALRDPRDVVLSCYFQNLLLNPANANFLSLERTARHYADLMRIWRAVREWEGFAWLEVSYEKMVLEPLAEGRRLTEFLGLEWAEPQAHFYETVGRKQRYAPTYQDVTQRIYSRSAGRWHAYEKYLARVLPDLEPFCRAFGYA